MRVYTARRVGDRDAGAHAELQTALGLDAQAIRSIPLFSEDVHALENLQRMSTYLFGES